MRHYLRQRKDSIWTIGGIVHIGDKKFIIDKNKGWPVNVFYVKDRPTGVTNNWVDVIQLKLYDKREIKSFDAGF